MSLGKFSKLIALTIVLILAATAALFNGCQKSISVDKINISQGKSEKFSSEEVNNAINCVIAKFNSEFKGCKLTGIWYDESKSDPAIQDYKKHGRGSENNIDPENIIMLLSNFNVDQNGGDGSLNPNSAYTDWQWTLIRNGKTAGWVVDDWGY